MKYEFTGEVKVIGGWIEKEENLSQVYGNARVYGDAQVSKCLIIATRSDGYTFSLFEQKDGPLIITAGCRFFTIPEARKHWTETRGGTQLGDESLALVDHLERMAGIQGLKDNS